MILETKTNKRNTMHATTPPPGTGTGTEAGTERGADGSFVSSSFSFYPEDIDRIREREYPLLNGALNLAYITRTCPGPTN